MTSLVSWFTWLGWVSGATVIGLCCLIWLIEKLSDVGRLENNSVLLGAKEGEWLPRLKAHFRYIADGYHIITEAFDEKSDAILQIPLAGYKHYILPRKYVEELRSLPPAVLSSTGGIADYFIGDYTGLEEHNMIGPTTWAAIRNNLTSTTSLGACVERLETKCRVVAGREFGSTSEWKEVPLHHSILSIITQLTAPIFVSDTVDQDPLWRETAMNFATNVMILTLQLKVWPAFLVPVVFPFYSRWWTNKWYRYRALQALKTEIKARQNETTQEAAGRKLHGHEDMIDWLLAAGGQNAKQPHDVVNRLLGISFAAVHTSSIVMTRIIFTLAQNWDEYAPALIAEMNTAVAEQDGKLTIHAINKMTKLDSFMKEALRYLPFTAVSFQRKVYRDHTLSDGLVLRKGSQIFMAAGPLSHSPTYYQDPEKFQGFRFDTGKEVSSEAKHETYTTSGINSMLFGHGRWACPGRFYAGLQGKIILLHILANYELKLPQENMMPPTMVYADTEMIDPFAVLMFKRRL